MIEIAVAAIVTVPTLITALVAARRAGKAATEAAEANAAVNHQPPEEPKLIDIVKSIAKRLETVDERGATTEQMLLKHLEWHLDRG